MNRYLNLKNFILIIFILPSLAACDGSFFNRFSENIDFEGNVIAHDMIVLGEQLEDPYSLDAMSSAFNSLYPTRAGRVELEATDYYIRFLPKNQDEYERLEQAGIMLLDHPMDYEILREGDYYHDPAIEEGNITWQYAVIPKGMLYPKDIEHEVLDACYIPENSKDYIQTKSSGIDWDEVERKSYILTGNQNMLTSLTKTDKEESKPRGTITIEDPKLGPDPIGVKGVRVSCNVFVKTAHAYTNDKGEYIFEKSFKSKPRYRMVFKNKYGFGIGFNLILQPASASTLGKASAEGIDVHITNASDRKLFSRAVVNNTAYEYYEKCKESGTAIKTPPGNLRIWLFQKMESSSAVMMQQGAYIDGSKIGEYLGEFSILVKMFLPDITLGLKGLDTYDQIYSVVNHELAHASHFMKVGVDYWDNYINFIISSFVSSGFVTYGTGVEENHGYCEVGEMWAYYVQAMLYNQRYQGEQVRYGEDYWFYPQIFHYLDDRGLGYHKIFAALSDDVDNRDILKKKLVSLYPQFKTTINQAFARYN